MKHIIFDDDKWNNFFPLTLTRSTGDLRVGILKLRQRISAYLDLDETKVIISTFLEDIYKEQHKEWQINRITDEETIFINSRLMINRKFVKKIQGLPSNSCLGDDDNIFAARLNPQKGNISSEDISKLFKNLKKIEIKGKYIWNYLWELIGNNAEYISQDFKDFFYDKDNYFETEMGTTILNPYNIWIGKDTKIKPGVIIDATDGPVILDENVLIMSNAVLVGPVYIGKNSVIKVGAKIYEGTSIGPVCKVGGEVEETIIQAYSNKQNDGFLGHSYIGEWVNIGAGTTNSDLKNNYKNVEVYFYPSGKKVDSESKFIGTFIGDHTKIGINSTINTGTVLGVGCNLFGRELIKDFIPSFRWGEGSDLVEYQENKFFETAKIVKQRRNLKLTKNEKELYTNIRKMDIE